MCKIATYQILNLETKNSQILSKNFQQVNFKTKNTPKFKFDHKISKKLTPNFKFGNFDIFSSYDILMKERR